jgi:UDP-2-acetamido-2,6-beta-L-arabino-hexul-4-ose reductase
MINTEYGGEGAKMKVLVTGAKGFVGRNLIHTLENTSNTEILQYDIDTDISLLPEYTAECDFVFHLAGVNRPENPEDFMKGNFGFTSLLLDNLIQAGNKAPVLITSSIQAALDNPYGQSKKAGEDLIFQYGRENGVETYVYRMPNVFGKWCRPNYNSAIATFCHNIARGLPITVNDPSHRMQLVYIDDVVAELIRASAGEANKDPKDGFCYIEPVHSATLGEIVALLESFRDSRKTLDVPDMSDPLTKKLYATYLSYLPEKGFSYPLKMNIDDRGSFTEILRTADRGQFSVNVAKPGITKGNHWHHTKNEKFLVVSGKGVIRFRKVGSSEVTEYFVSGDKLEVVDIPTGYTHNIENIGDTDLVTFMWCNECFDPDHPDTVFLKV